MVRRTICLDCRTLLFDDERCDAAAGHRLVRLDTASGRAALVDEVWGTEAERGTRRPVQPGHILSAALAVAPMLVGALFLLLAVDAGRRLDWMLMAGLFPLALIVAVPTLTHCLRGAVERRALMPRGVPVAAPASGLAGVVVGGELMISATGTACVACGVTLRHRRGVLLQDAVCTAFAIRLDDGRLVRVPAGRIRLHGAAPNAIHAWEMPVLPGAARAPVGGELPLFPFERFEQLTLRSGQRIELSSGLTSVPDPHAAPRLYREPAATWLVASGTPIIRIVGC